MTPPSSTKPLNLPAPLFLASLLVAGSAAAFEPPEALVEAMDIDPAWVVPGSVSRVHPLEGASAQEMLGRRVSLGVIPPTRGPLMALLSTGRVDDITATIDYDYPPGGSVGDRATLAFSLAVPEAARAFSFDFYFLSREYPEWVGDLYNDRFTVEMVNPANSGQIVVDDAGGEVSVNSTLFVVTEPQRLFGTGFDNDGGTGWVRTTMPCEGGTTLELTFSVADQGDGVWDSAVLLDDFRFLEETGGEGTVAIPFDELPPPGDAPPLQLFTVVPTEGPIEGGYPVEIRGEGLEEALLVRVGGTTLLDATGWTVADEGGTLTVPAWPAGQDLGPVDVAVESIARQAALPDAFVYFYDPPPADDDDDASEDGASGDPTGGGCDEGSGCGVGARGGGGMIPELLLLLLVGGVRRRRRARARSGAEAGASTFPGSPGSPS